MFGQMGSPVDSRDRSGRGLDAGGDPAPGDRAQPAAADDRQLRQRGAGRAGGSRQHAQTPAAGWSFTDDKGVTIALATPPARIVSDLLMAAALWDFGVQPVAVFGWDVTADNTLGVGGGNIDPAAVEIVGNATEPLNLEAAIAVSPDLFTTFDGDPADPMSYWSIDPELLDDVQAVAPVLAINSNYVRTDLVVTRIGELAAALGADLGSAEVSAAKADAEAAAAEFVATVEADPGPDRDLHLRQRGRHFRRQPEGGLRSPLLRRAGAEDAGTRCGGHRVLGHPVVGAGEQIPGGRDFHDRAGADVDR